MGAAERPGRWVLQTEMPLRLPKEGERERDSVCVGLEGDMYLLIA